MLLLGHHGEMLAVILDRLDRGKTAMDIGRVMFDTDFPFVCSDDAVGSVEAASLCETENEKVF